MSSPKKVCLLLSKLTLNRLRCPWATSQSQAVDFTVLTCRTSVKNRRNNLRILINLKYFSLGSVQCHTDAIEPALNPAFLCNALSCLVCLPSCEEQAKSHTLCHCATADTRFSSFTASSFTFDFCKHTMKNSFRRPWKGENNIHMKGVFKIFHFFDFLCVIFMFCLHC